MDSFEENPSQKAANNYYKLLVQKFVFPCLLLNQEEEILVINGNLGKYIPIQNNKSGQTLAQFVDKTVYQNLQKGIREVINGEESVLIEGSSLSNNAVIPFYCYISIIVSITTSERLILIEFEDAQSANNASVNEMQQHVDSISQSVEHDIKNLVTNFILLLNLEESAYSNADKIQDLKKMQEKSLTAFRKNIIQLKRLLNHLSTNE